MSAEKLILGVPSKGRLMEQTADYFAARGLAFARTGHERGYRGEIAGFDDVEIAYLSASEIARHLQLGRIHLGVTGEDLIREHIADADQRCDFVAKLGFGRADVVVAVPECWIDVATVADLEEAAAIFYREHGRRLRVATKYMNLTRHFFARAGLVSYRLVESLGATEGTPAAQTAEIIVDITTTGTTLRANHLKILADGLILRSEACLVASRVAARPDAVRVAEARIRTQLAQFGATATIGADGEAPPRARASAGKRKRPG
ncbi:MULTISPECIES: ATP phosphoribosyltransferase [Rhodomicrobium]|uniref:ATP phosphoribosyltransferase n=1 Tax=Rhodomicrobium TaxID=1068 RepID=UPI000B4B75DC|nr:MULTISPECIES: ATP phosphoribosyltransferase [Rhodomicrobium]